MVVGGVTSSLIGSFTPSWTTRPPLTRQDRFDPDRPVATQSEAEALVALVDSDCPGEKGGLGWGQAVCPARETGAEERRGWRCPLSPSP